MKAISKQIFGLSLLFMLFTSLAYSQSGVSEKRQNAGAFDEAEIPAKPADGMQAFYSYIGHTLKYPKQAKKLGIEGKVFVEFIVDKQGNLTEVKSIKGIGAGCDKEAVRVIAQAAPWTPARHKGKIVKQRMVVPLQFKLGTKDKKKG